MTKITFNAYPGSQSGYFTSIGGSGEPINPYAITEVMGFVHSIEVEEELSGKFYLGVGSISGEASYEVVNFGSNEEIDLTDMYSDIQHLLERSCDVTVTTGDPGAGAIEKVITVNSNSVVLEGADVWVTTDIHGVDIIAGTLKTNAFGDVKFMLDIGVYYLWVQKPGYNFTNPTTLEVTNDNS